MKTPIDQLPPWLSQAVSAQEAGDSPTLALTGEDAKPYLTDWRKRYSGKALAVVFPRTTAALQSIVKACVTNGVAMVPQGGNTGLVGGAVGDLQGDGSNTLIINTSRLRETAVVDSANRTLSVSAGYTLLEVQQLAEQAGLYFPLSLASEGTCTIGGNLATNAGGTAVLRYGNTRELTLGLQAVMPDGALLDSLTGLRKNNTGYDLRHLLIGAEGTLGIISTVTLRLFAKPKTTLTAWLGVNDAQQAVGALNSLLDRFDAQLTAFEWMQQDALMLVLRHFGGQLPVAAQTAGHALVELSSPHADSRLAEAFESWAQDALQGNLAQDCAIAQNLEQAKQMWALRENISEAQAREGLNVKHDVSLPVSSIPGFLDVNLPRLQQMCPGIRPVIFGHLGDGNLHYNFSCPAGEDSRTFLASMESVINEAVLNDVQNFGGSVSAEHGIGLLKRDLLPRYKDATAIAVMKSVKRALDPLNLMNPGKVL